MELFNSEEFEKYVRTNYKLLFTLSPEQNYQTEFGGKCDACQKDAFLKIHDRAYNTPKFRQNPATQFTIFFIQCPSCSRLSFLHTVSFMTYKQDEDGDETDDHVYEYYQLYRIPVIEETYSAKHIPNTKENKTLIETVSEASFCLANGKYTSATIMFRRAIQVIAKQLGAKGKTLFNQLEWLKNNENNLKIDLTDVFHDNAKIIKDIGNQGAHPDDDVDLHSFTHEQANGVHDLFLHMTYEVFMKPAKMKALQEELKKERKLK